MINGHVVCVGEELGVNSIKCEKCGKWIHGRCSGVHRTLTSVIDFECGMCQRDGCAMMEPFELEDMSWEGVAEYLGYVLNDG